jgi:hypothetical protein
MKVGYAQTVITPALDRPVYLAGFGANRRAQTIHDELYVRALAVQQGSVTLALVALDLIGLFHPDIHAVIERAALPDVAVLIACTHTHHAPDTMGLWGPDSKTGGVDELYLEEVKTKTASTIRLAVENLQPAIGMKHGSVLVAGVAKNARDPELRDEELTVLQFIGQEGKPLASLFDFPCHPEVLWDDNPHITSDYAAALRRQVEAQSGAPCIFFVGGLGGMMTPDVNAHSFAESEAMGQALARAGLALLEQRGVEPVQMISIQKQAIAVKLTNILYKLAFWRKLLPDARDRQGRVHSEVNLIRLGAAWFATVPGELLPKLGLALKAEMKRAGAETVGIIGLGNDELGYILPKEDFHYPWNPFRPGKHYEETNSIGKEIGPAVMQAMRDLLAAASWRQSEFVKMKSNRIDH